MCFLSTKQNIQSRLRVEDNKGKSIFYNKSGDTVLLATANVWDNIKIVETYIVKYNVSNLMSIMIRYLDVETLYCGFRNTSEKIIYDVVEDVEDVKKKLFSNKKYNYTFGKMY